MDESRCDYYNDEIFYVFVNGIRKLRNPERNEGCDPSSKMTVVSWCDGDIGQITSMLSDKVSNKDKLCKIIRNKHSPKRAGTEAGCDLTNFFKSIKNVAKILTMKNDLNTLNSSQASNSIENGSRVNLKKSNKETLVDFCGCTLEIMIRSNAQASIRKGFIANAMID